MLAQCTSPHTPQVLMLSASHSPYPVIFTLLAYMQPTAAAPQFSIAGALGWWLITDQCKLIVSPLLGCDIHCATCSYGCHVFRGMSHHISYCTQYCQNPQVWPLLPTPPHTERCKVIHTYVCTPVCISVCASCYMQNTTSTCWTR